MLHTPHPILVVLTHLSSPPPPTTRATRPHQPDRPREHTFTLNNAANGLVGILNTVFTEPALWPEISSDELAVLVEHGEKDAFSQNTGGGIADRLRLRRLRGLTYDAVGASKAGTMSSVEARKARTAGSTTKMDPLYNRALVSGYVKWGGDFHAVKTVEPVRSRDEYSVKWKDGTSSYVPADQFEYSPDGQPFSELSSPSTSPEESVVGLHITYLLPNRRWYPGVITKWSASTGRHRIRFNDGDEGWYSKIRTSGKCRMLAAMEGAAGKNGKSKKNKNGKKRARARRREVNGSKRNKGKMMNPPVRISL